MSERLNIQNLIDLLVNRHTLDRKEVEKFVKEFFLLIEDGLEKDKCVKIKGLGTFKLVEVESRESVNVNTGKRIEIQGHSKISFTPDTSLRDIINKPFAHFETVVLNENVEFNDIEQESVDVLSNEEEPKNEEKTSIAEELQIIEVQKTVKEPIDSTEEPITVEELKKTEEKEEVTPAITTEKVIQEVIAEEKAAVEPPITPDSKSTNKKESASNKILPIVIILTILLCGLFLFLTYYSDIFSGKKTQPEVIAPTAIENSIEINPLATDSIENQLETAPVSIENETENPVVQTPTNDTDKNSTVPFSQRPVNADSTSFEIVGTKTQHTIKEGETLIRISYRYYNTKDLWPYLVMHNRDIIKNPDSAPLGATINIPELKKK